MDIDEIDEDETFGFSRNYFLAKETKASGKKSSSKISDIEPVEEQELKTALASLPQKHEEEVRALLDRYKEEYPKWYFHLRCGFGLIMYGFGSKKSLIENFASTSLTNHSVLVINGFLQSVNLKQVAATLAELWWEQTSNKKSSFQQSINTRSMDDVLSFLNKASSEESPFICVIIHNIDGPALRDAEEQELLAQIASCKNVRVVASVDHIHSPLLWEKKMIHTQFNWWWFHVPTFAAYEAESIFHPLILGNAGKGQSATSAVIVLHSLTPNAQGVFRVLAEYLLAHPDQPGMPYDDLFSVSRERFLVSRQVTLNSHLTEFKDHELVKVKRNVDGQDCLFIPIPHDALQKLLLEINH